MRTNSLAAPLAPFLVLLSLATAQGERTPVPLEAGEVVTGIGADLDAWCTAMEAFGMSGALLVEHNGEVVLRKGYGIAERTTNRPITSQTRFDIGSVAKQFTATAILTLVAQGRLRLESTLGEVLDDVPHDRRELTIDQLLTHRSGLPYHAGGRDPLAAPMAFEPGARFGYSNVGYSILARVVDARSDHGFAATLQELFERAGVPDIAPSGVPIDWPDLAHGYVDDFDFGDPRTPSAVTTLQGAGGYACTVGELHRWIHALADGTVLPKALADEMFTDHVDPDHPHRGYGYGWEILETIRGTPVIRHGGTYNGFNAEVRRYPDEDKTIVFLSNTMSLGREMRSAVVNQVALLLTGRDVPSPPATAPWDPDEAKRAAGRYRTDDHVAVTLRPDGEHLRVEGHDQRAIDVLYPATSTAVELSRRSAERSKALIRAVASGDQETARELLDPAWVWPVSYRSLQRLVLETDSDPEIVGCALIDPRLEIARCLARVASTPDGAWLELVATPRGILTARRTTSPVARDFVRTGPGAYTAFDVFTGERVDLAVQGEGDSDRAITLTSEAGSIRMTRMG